MPEYTSNLTNVKINVADGDPLPAPASQWEDGDGGSQKRTRRRADTGTIPTQNK